MIKLVDGNGAKKLDNEAQKLGISGMVLMERAALSVADFIKDCFLAENADKRIVVLCGCGNNGGDGVACARILYERGYSVEVFVLGKEEKFSSQMKEQINLANNSGASLKIVQPASLLNKSEVFHKAVIVDAIFGVGFKGELEGEIYELAEFINSIDAVRVAVDIPSGVNASDGKVLTNAFKCDYTITFGVNKIGLMVYPGKDYAGETIVTDIGFPKKALEIVDFKAFSFDKGDIRHYLPKRREYSNKGDFGKILVIAGSEDMCGAAYLSALAAYRSGAGLVRIFTPNSNTASLKSLIPEAILTTYSDKSDAEICEDTDEKLEKAVKNWADVIVIGPGLGISKRSRSLVKKTVLYSEIPTVIDADGLKLYRKVIEELHQRRLDLTNDIKKNFILTPHIKEVSDLLYISKDEVKENLIKQAEILRNSKGVIILKEAATLVVGMGECYINNSGNSAMAKAGSGDVLTGIIAALASNNNITPLMIGAMGVYIHGLSGDLLKETKGKYGIIASELADEVAEVMKRYA